LEVLLRLLESSALISRITICPEGGNEDSPIAFECKLMDIGVRDVAMGQNVSIGYN